MGNPLDVLEPRSLWSHFDNIRKIPRPSGKEKRIREFMKAFARENSLEYREDEAGNICIAAPATPGHENAPPVVIQGHMDMVCEKNSDTEFDFENDPIEVVVDGDWVSAVGTTLGADNGIGLAAGMACVTDESVIHGPLELLFTVDEETGLTGAMNLDASLVRARKLLNLDSEDDGVLFVGCAGGQNVTLSLKAKRTDAPKLPAASISVRGLRGGHSGLDIGENRGNAIKILGRILQNVTRSVPVSLGAFDGGSAHNAIPREARAVVVHQAGDLEKIRAAVAAAVEAATVEYGAIEPNMVVEVSGADTPVSVFDSTMVQTLLRLLVGLPHGALSMSRDIEGLVETSMNLATVKERDGQISILLSIRSSVAAALISTVEQVRAIGELAGVHVHEHEGYPGWQTNMDSQMLALAREVFLEIWGKEPKVTAIHAGLECGLVGEKLPGMDMISFGPELQSVHSPDEKVQISSTARFFEAVKAMLARLA